MLQKKVTLPFPVALSRSKHQWWLFSFYETSRYVKWYILLCLFGVTCVISAASCGLPCNFISTIYVVVFNLEKTSLVLSFQLSDWCWPFSPLILRLLTLITYTVPFLFFDRVQKENCYIYLRTQTSRSVSRMFFVVWLSINMFFLSFTGIS